MTILISFSYSLHLVEHFFTFQVALGKFFILSYLEEELLKFYFPNAICVISLTKTSLFVSRFWNFEKYFGFGVREGLRRYLTHPFEINIEKAIIFYVNWYFIQSQEDLSPQLFQITSFCSPFWEDNLKIILYWFQPITSKFYFFEKIKILLVSPDYNKISAVSKSVKSEMFTEKRIIFKYCCSLQLVELLVVVIISINDSHVWGWVWVDEKVELDYMNYSVKIGDFGKF